MKSNILRVIFAFLAVFVVIQTLTFFLYPNSVFQQIANVSGYTDISSREAKSVAQAEFTYVPKKCGEIKHTDGEILTFCIATFSGSTGGFYDSSKELMVVQNFSQYTLIHEITHATTLHFYKKGYTNINSVEVQEKMAYNAEHLLMQIVAFKEDMNITADISNEKKLKLGIPVVEKTVATKSTKNNKGNSVKTGQLLTVSAVK